MVVRRVDDLRERPGMADDLRVMSVHRLVLSRLFVSLAAAALGCLHADVPIGETTDGSSSSGGEACGDGTCDVGEDNLFGNIDDALNRAREIVGEQPEPRPPTAVPEVAREVPPPAATPR